MAEKMLSESEGYDLLNRYGIPTPKYRIVTRAEDAGAAAEAIGFPVVMKIISPQIVHKSDAGGVIVGVGTKEAAQAAFNQIVTSARVYDADAEITGVIVENQAAPGLELIVGGKTDPTFGKVITFGIGGTLVELMKDVTLRILPISEEDIREMVKEIHAYPLITGYRGSKPKDEEILIQIIKNICKMFDEMKDLCEFDVNPIRLYDSGACAVDARIILDDDITLLQGDTRDEVPLDYFKPKSVAVIGASDEKTKMGYAVMHNLLHFPGKVFPINNKRDTIQGLKAYPTILDVPEESVDLAVITVPARHVPGVMEECGKKGVKIAVVITAGFKEMSEEGHLLEDRIVEIAHRYGTRIVGPNCLGLIIPPIGLDTTYVAQSPNPGNIAFISQSGAIVNTVVDFSLTKDIGFSMVVSVGNQADLNFFDYLRAAAADPNTDVIIMYIEQIKNGKAFMEVVSEVTRHKPVVALKAGSSARGQAAAASHTGSLSGSYDVYMEAFRKAGVLLVHTLSGAFLAAEMLSHPKRYPKGRRAIVVTNAGGFAVLSSDYSERYGVKLIDLPEYLVKELDSFLPEFWNRGNPVDLLGDATEQRFERTFEILAKNDALWDMCFIVGFPNNILSSEQLANQILKFSKSTDKRIIPTLLGGASMDRGRKILHGHNIPSFEELDFTFRVVGRLLWQIYRVKAQGVY
ncbi:MAG TPA: acetate--CoA ligase family protein [Methanospirillum sp.]|nr:acetate--CoA ligase family protein [Methanospirillum sp.]